MSNEETGDETIGDVLSRTSKLLKDDMIAEVQAYGMEVDSSWTKDEIMEHFEEFLTEQAADEPDVEEPVVQDTAAEPEVLPPLDLPPEPPIVPETYQEVADLPPNSGDVRIMRSPGWGRTGGALAP